MSGTTRIACLALTLAAVMGCRIQDKIKEWRVNPAAGVTPAGCGSTEWQSDQASTKLSGVTHEQAHAEAKRVAAQFGEIELEHGDDVIRLGAQGMKFFISLHSTIADTTVVVKGSWPHAKADEGRALTKEILRQIVEPLRYQQGYQESY